jgi:hypothetical protein
MPHSLRGAGISHAGCSCSSRARARVRSIGKIKRFWIVTIFVGRAYVRQPSALRTVVRPDVRLPISRAPGPELLGAQPHADPPDIQTIKREFAANKVAAISFRDPTDCENFPIGCKLVPRPAPWFPPQSVPCRACAGPGSESGSLLTPRWREMDSNHRSLAKSRGSRQVNILQILAGRLSGYPTVGRCGDVRFRALVKGSMGWLLCLPVGQASSLASSCCSTFFFAHPV